MRSMTLEQAFRQVLAEMSLLQYGKTASYNGSGAKGENPDPRPQGESWTLADHWAAKWARDPSEWTLEAARMELRAWKRREVPVEGDDSTLEDWVLSDGEGYAVAQVAGKFGIAAQRVVRLRLKHGRDAEFGFKPATATRAERKDQSRERVLNLASQGMTLRQIEAITDVKRETARRWLKEAA